ncbi:MAG: hypothetical protein HY423_00745 [Candidatus Lambdaproteobacteria bacterium]|nr:hypothetical protein [Candidatus Lambdaproteobacteria bacterium]
MSTQQNARPPAPQEPADVIEAIYERGWTDGLPVVPPHAAGVQAMLDAVRLKAADEVGTIEARHTRITADKVAINAMMAGCRPEYMPVVLAAVKGLCQPAFNYHGPATSTGGSNIVLIVNGPIAPELNINARDNAFGPGWRANATIGRAIRLLMMNALNTRPGVLDRSALGTPGKYTFCFAEHEAGSPWEPLHVERGFRPEQSTVTLFAAEAVIQVQNDLSKTPEPLLICMADAMANLGSRNITGQSEYVVVFAGMHTQVLRAAGWSKRQVKRFLYDHARRSLGELKRAERIAGPIEPGDEQRFQHVTRTPEDIIVLCAGGAVGQKSACLPAWGSPEGSRTVTMPIELPS